MNNWCEFNAPDRKIIIKSFLNYSTNRATGYCGCGRRLPTQKKNGIGGQESREYRFQTYVGQLNCMIHHVRWNCFFLGGPCAQRLKWRSENKMLEENQISLLPSGTQAPNFQRRHGFLFEEESLCLSWSWWGFCVSWSSFFPWKIMDESYPGIRRLVKNFAIVIVWAYCNLSDDPIAHMVVGEWYPKGQQKSHSVGALQTTQLVILWGYFWFCRNPDFDHQR